MKPPILVFPSAASRRAAREALALRATLPVSRRGGLDPEQARQMGVFSGVTRARSIARGEPQDARDVVRFFDRFRGHIVSARRQNKTLSTSRMLLSEGLWGGPTMEREARQAVKASGR